MRSTVKRALRIGAAWAVLAAILACGGGDEDDTPPPPPVTSVQPTQPVQPVQPVQPIQPIQPVQPVQPVAQQPSYFQLRPGFLPDPQTARGQAGGTMPATMLTGSAGGPGGYCRGHVPTTPQHTMTLESGFSQLRVMVHSAQDTTLIIRGPDGQYYCSDDEEGLNPIVARAFPAGTYQIYVGTYHSGIDAPYVLGISELRSVTPATLGY